MSCTVNQLVCLDRRKYRENARDGSTGERKFWAKFQDSDFRYFPCLVTESRYPDLSNSYISVKAYDPANGKIISGRYIMERNVAPVEIAMSEYNAEQLEAIKAKLVSDSSKPTTIAKKGGTEVVIPTEKTSKTSELISAGKAAADIGLKVKGGKILIDRISKLLSGSNKVPSLVRVAVATDAAKPFIALAVAAVLQYTPMVNDKRVQVIRDCLLNYGTVGGIDMIPVEEWLDELFSCIPTDVVNSMVQSVPTQQRVVVNGSDEDAGGAH